ncbi:MAG: CdvA-like protein [Candidatus Bathyarchaeia archaeon]|nr:CdvA-like protein [Candidatus Bathyarchaeota archaeon]
MLSLWKYTFELASKDLELLRKKKQALDDLLASNKISQSTYEHLSRELGETLADVQKYLENIICKMKERMESLERQISILEIFLANVEILHVAGEIDDETYEKQSRALSIGLESMRSEINEIKCALERTEQKPAETAKCEETVVVEASSEPPKTPETSEIPSSGELCEEKTGEPAF